VMVTCIGAEEVSLQWPVHSESMLCNRCRGDEGADGEGMQGGAQVMEVVDDVQKC
jgi:hypothetical protein